MPWYFFPYSAERTGGLWIVYFDNSLYGLDQVNFFSRRMRRTARGLFELAKSLPERVLIL